MSNGIKSKLPNVGTTIFTKMSAFANEHQAINLSQGFPDFDPDSELMDLVTFHIQHGKNQYAPMAGVYDLRAAIAAKVNNSYHSKVNPDTNINITAGGTQAIFTSIMAFVNKGDEVIIIEPAFDCYGPAINLVGATVVPYEMKAPDFHIDWKTFESLVTPKTSMIIINTPHNPTGTILLEDDFMHLERIVKNKNIIILSDEVYEHLIFDGEKHCSILKFPSLCEKSIAIFSFGKTFHCTGWKVGYAIMAEPLMKEFRKVHQFNVFSVNSFVQYALADYLQNPSHYQSLPEFYQRKRDLLSQYISNSRLKLIPSKGSYFVLADYSAVSSLNDVEFAEWLTINHKLACIPVSVFYSSGQQDQLVRFCFAKSEAVLVEAGRIIENI